MQFLCLLAAFQVLNSHPGLVATTAHSAEVQHPCHRKSHRRRRPRRRHSVSGATQQCLRASRRASCSCSVSMENPSLAVDLENSTSSPMPEGYVKEGEKVKIRESKDKSGKNGQTWGGG